MSASPRTVALLGIVAAAWCGVETAPAQPAQSSSPKNPPARCTAAAVSPSVTGTVREERGGRPLPGAQVAVARSAEADTAELRVRPDSAGRYWLCGGDEGAVDGGPVAAATVRLPALGVSALTSGEGRFSLDRIPVGTRSGSSTSVTACTPIRFGSGRAARCDWGCESAAIRFGSLPCRWRSRGAACSTWKPRDSTTVAGAGAARTLPATSSRNGTLRTGGRPCAG